MADASGQAEIRGIDIDKIAKGFAELENKFKRICEVSSTSAREIRWYQKTSGFLDTTDTTAITASQIIDVAPRARPPIAEQSWTRNTSYVKKYFVSSPLIAIEDIKDADIDILMTNMHDLVRAVARQVDARIYSVLSAGVTNTNATSAGWDTASGSGVTLIDDLMEGKQNIYDDGYDPEGAWLLLSPKDYRSLITWLIEVKGSSIPGFASETLAKGVVYGILNLNIMVSTNVTANEAMIVTNKAMKWKTFMPITAVKIEEPGIGVTIRVWEEGEAILTDPNAANKITNTVA